MVTEAWLSSSATWPTEGIFYFSRNNTERKFQVMWFLTDYETVEALRAIDNKNNFDPGESGSKFSF